MNFWMIFQVFGIVSTWSVKALADGKITITEAAELGVQLGGLLGIPTDVTIPTAGAAAAPDSLIESEPTADQDETQLTPKEQLLKPQ